MGKKPFLNNIAVLLIFFVRHEPFRQVFEQVKKARPSRLYLYQDGPRPGRDDDEVSIRKCREIVSAIDWECEVHTLYQEKNFGCDPSGFIAQKWMFSSEDMGIVLEDDVVPSLSFFPFCTELLERYKNDTRINMICGMNNTGVSEHIQDSYLFTMKGSIWGWGSWKRVIDSWDGQYIWMDDKAKVECLRGAFDSDGEYYRYLAKVKQHKESGRAHFESILSYSMFSNHRLNIVPKYNMIKNIGVTSDATHSLDRIELIPKARRKLFFMKTYEIEFPLKHPDYVIRDLEFERKMTRTPSQKLYDRLSGIMLLIINGEWKILLSKVAKRFEK